MTTLDRKTLDKVASYSLNKKSKKLYSLNTKVKVKASVNHKLLPFLEKDYDAPKVKKGLEGKLVGYLDIPNRKELFPIIEFADKTKSIFFEYDLFILEAGDKDSPAPVSTLKPKKLPSVPDFLK